MSESQSETKMLSVSVTYADPENPLWLKVKVPDGSTVEQAIRTSDLLTRYPHMDLDAIKVGIFGKATELTTPINDGDRVELYLPITVDPKTVPRRKKPAEDK